MNIKFYYTGKESIKNPTTGLLKMYKIGRTDVMYPITAGSIPKSFPYTFICGNIGPIALKRRKSFEIKRIPFALKLIQYTAIQ